jgi:hypothetical protein
VSYGLTATAGPKAGVHDAVLAAVEAREGDPPEMLAHLEAVIEAATRLASAVGRPEDTITISVSGHSNPNHAPAEGWAHEFVTLSVAVTSTGEAP